MQSPRWQAGRRVGTALILTTGILVWYRATSTLADDPHRFPLLFVDGYLETGANVATPGDLVPVAGGYLPFSVIQQSLQRGKAVDKAPYSLIPDFNAEANVITALICHADHLQPKSVCGWPVIKAILVHVK